MVLGKDIFIIIFAVNYYSVFKAFKLQVTHYICMISCSRGLLINLPRHNSLITAWERQHDKYMGTFKHLNVVLGNRLQNLLDNRRDLNFSGRKTLGEIKIMTFLCQIEYFFWLSVMRPKQNPKFEKTEVADSQLVLALHLFNVSKKGAISSDQSQREVKQNQKIIPDYFQPSIELSFDKLTLATNLLTGVILSLNVIYYISHLLCVLWLVNFSVQLVKFQTLLVLKIFSLCLNPEINIANFVPTLFSWSVLWVMEACFSYHIYGH